MFVKIPIEGFANRRTKIQEVVNKIRLIKSPFETGPWVAGGSLRRGLTNDPEADFDYFFPSEPALKTFVEEMKGRGLTTKEGKMNVSLEGFLNDPEPEDDVLAKDTKKEYIKVQAIKLYQPTLEAVLDNFDFTICQFGWDGSDKLTLNPEALWDVAQKRLVVHKITYGASSIRRMLKYSTQGFTLCEGTAKTFLEEIAANPQNIRSDVQYVD